MVNGALHMVRAFFTHILAHLSNTTSISILPSSILGTLRVPPSKSMTQRLCAAALLHRGTTYIHQPGNTDDDQAALRIIRDLGARIELLNEGVWRIDSNGLQPIHNTIFCGESGLSARLFTTLAALSSQPITLTGTGSLLRRPMSDLLRVLQSLQVRTTDTQGCLPITVQGPLSIQDVTIDASLSSQYLSGLLFAYAFAATKEVVITANELVSTPYVDLTLDVLKAFGRKVRHDQYRRFIITPVTTSLKEVVVSPEADWSSAAYWLVAAVIKGSVRLEGLQMKSSQGDLAILDIVRGCGGKVEMLDDALLVNMATTHLTAFEYDATHTPDLFPILAILATACKGVSVIQGLHRLSHKESNRIQSITEMLHAFGVPFTIASNALQIEGVTSLKAANIRAHHDHRIAMAAAIGALRARGAVTIDDAVCVSKSYPAFFEHLRSLGVNTTSVL